MKTCITCGCAEQRRGEGREALTNISPITGQCLSCLSKSVKAKGMPRGPEPPDWAKRAAKDDD